MREISTEKIGIGEHVMIDGVEYVADKASLLNPCERCAFDDGPEPCSYFIGCDGIIFKRAGKESSYRPYRDTDELIEDWKERFKPTVWPSHSMPLVWVMSKTTCLRTLVTGYDLYSVVFNGTKVGFRDLFDNYTYLDGSPCGKEVTL